VPSRLLLEVLGYQLYTLPLNMAKSWFLTPRGGVPHVVDARDRLGVVLQ